MQARAKRIAKALGAGVLALDWARTASAAAPALGATAPALVMETDAVSGVTVDILAAETSDSVGATARALAAGTAVTGATAAERVAMAAATGGDEAGALAERIGATGGTAVSALLTETESIGGATTVRCPFRPEDRALVLSPEREAIAATPCAGGFAGPYPCKNIDLLAFVPLAAMGCTAGNDLWGWTDAAMGREYALMGCSDGAAFIDITIPTSPVYLGRLPSHTVSSPWRDIKVHADHAFIVSEAAGHGMQVFDLRLLRGVTSPPVTFAATAHYGGFGSAHNLAINEATGFAYAVGSGACAGGPHVVNIQNPASPVFAGCVASDGYTHDTQCVVYAGPDAARRGREICFSSNEDTLTIVDVTVKSAPVQLSRTTYEGVQYTHQGWLTEDHRHFLIDDELDETRAGHNTRTYIFDVSDLTAPVNTGRYTGPVRAIDHNLYIRGSLVYEANYRSGLRVLDLAGIASGSLVEAAYFDIFPEDDAAAFNGAWSNYPFLPSGVVIVSGIEQGLFVLRLTPTPGFDLEVRDPILSVCSGGSDATVARLLPYFGYAGSATLSALGLPPGAAAGFSVNPVAVPGDSTLAISTAGAAAGLHDFTLSASDGTSTRDRTLTLIVAEAPPPPPPLIQPADGSTGQPLVATLQWAAFAPEGEYDVEISTDPLFGTLVDAASVTSTHATSPRLSANTVHYWRVRGRNPCGTGAFSEPFHFRTRTVPPLLVVDDDDDAPDVRSHYTLALNILEVSYDLWDTAAPAASAGSLAAHPDPSEPAESALRDYRAILWFSGNAAGGASDPMAGPRPDSEAGLASYLDGGKCLLLSSQDYFSDRGETVSPFMSAYLGLGSASESGLQTRVTGVGGAFAGLGPYTLAYPISFQNRSDLILPGPAASTAFNGNAGSAAISLSASFRSAYFGFPIEALQLTGRIRVLRSALEHCGVGPGEPGGLTVERTASELVLSWSPPRGVCGGGGVHAVYEGRLSSLRQGLYDHDTSLACAVSDTFLLAPLAMPPAGDGSYYLVVAHGEFAEGSYGRAGDREERPPSAQACAVQQDLTSCF